jgi:hypothetical protein
LEKRIAAVHDKIRAQLKGLEAGIDPRLVKEIVDELQVEEQALRAKLEALGSDQELANVAALTELARHAPGLRDALQNGGPEHQRKVFVRIVRAVHWVPDHERLEIRMGVPAGGGGSAPDGAGQNPCGLRRCPGWESNPHGPSGPATFKAAVYAVPPPGRQCKNTERGRTIPPTNARSSRILCRLCQPERLCDPEG